MTVSNDGDGWLWGLAAPSEEPETSAEAVEGATQEVGTALGNVLLAT